MFINDQEIHFLNKRECKILLSSITNLKHKLVVLLMLDAGLRVSEAVSLKISYFDFRNRKLSVPSLKKRMIQTKYRTIPLSNRLYNCLADYLYKKDFGPDSYLFPSSTSPGHMTRFAVNKFLRKLRVETNIHNLHPHALRHTCATSHLANGADIVHIKEMLGHRNINTTAIYTHVPEEILRNTVDKATYEKVSVFQKIKNFLFNNHRRKLISLPQHNTNLPTIGRTDEITTITSYATRDINTILLGPIGAGKSHLLQQINPENKKVLKLDDTHNIKQSLLYLLLYLYKNDKNHVFNLLYGDYDLTKLKTTLNRESIPNLCNEIIKVVKPKEYLLVIDSVDGVTPKGIKALELLKDTFTIITSAREIPLNKGSFLWNFETVYLKPLPRKDALHLIHKLSYDLDIEDYELFRNHIFEQSNGNPRVIYEIIDRYRKEPVISNDVVRDIKHFGSLKEIDMSIVFIIGLASLAILRYLSREADQDSYRFIGGAAMILLILFRYFVRGTKRTSI